MAAAWLTNAPAAVLVNYSLALLLVTVAVLRRSPRVVLLGALAVVLGAALAAFYVFPAAYEEMGKTSRRFFLLVFARRIIFFSPSSTMGITIDSTSWFRSSPSPRSRHWSVAAWLARIRSKVAQQDQSSSCSSDCVVRCRHLAYAAYHFSSLDLSSKAALHTTALAVAAGDKCGLRFDDLHGLAQMAHPNCNLPGYACRRVFCLAAPSGSVVGHLRRYRRDARELRPRGRVRGHR